MKFSILSGIDVVESHWIKNEHLNDCVFSISAVRKVSSLTFFLSAEGGLDLEHRKVTKLYKTVVIF